MLGIAHGAESALLRKGRTTDRLYHSIKPGITDSSQGSDSSGSEATLVQEVSDFDNGTGDASDSEGHNFLNWDITTKHHINIDNHITAGAGYPRDLMDTVATYTAAQAQRNCSGDAGINSKINK